MTAKFNELHNIFKICNGLSPRVIEHVTMKVICTYHHLTILNNIYVPCLFTRTSWFVCPESLCSSEVLFWVILRDRYSSLFKYKRWVNFRNKCVKKKEFYFHDRLYYLLQEGHVFRSVCLLVGFLKNIKVRPSAKEELSFCCR